MKKTQFAEIKNLEIKALLVKRSEIKNMMTEIKLKKDVKDVKSIFKKRKDLAQVLTVLRQKQLLEALKETIK